MGTMKEMLKRQAELHWWNFGTKTLDYSGDLRGLLERQQITYTKRKTELDGIYEFRFKSMNGVSYKVRSTIEDFPHQAKKAVQMELVRMGDKATLYVQGAWRPTVTVNH